MSSRPALFRTAPPSGDATVETIRTALAALDTMHEADGWDRLPSVYTLFRPAVGQLRVGDTDGTAVHLIAEPWWLPSAIWATDDTGAVLQRIARRMKTIGPGIAGTNDVDTVQGFAFVSEAWMGLDEAARRHADAGNAGSLRDIPGRLEIRAAIAVDRAHTRYVHMRERDGGTGNHYANADGTPLPWGGRLFDALQLMVDTLPEPGRARH